jgi:sugar phosphate isomerase/epimerase
MRGVGHPRFGLNLDTGALTDEGRPPAETIRELGAEAPGTIAHVQVKDPNRLGPGMGALDFAPIRDALAGAGYADWLSVEAFDFTPGLERIARESLAHLREVWGP